MTDHAVGRVHGLVGRHARQARARAPEGRRHHAVGKILGETFDRGAHRRRLRRDAPGLRPTIRDTARDRRRAPPSPARPRPLRHGHGGCAARAGLSRARASTAGPNQRPQATRRMNSSATMAKRTAPSSTSSAKTPRNRRSKSGSVCLVQPAVQPADERAHPYHRVADRLEHDGRITDRHLDQEGEQCHGKRAEEEAEHHLSIRQAQQDHAPSLLLGEALSGGISGRALVTQCAAHEIIDLGPILPGKADAARRRCLRQAAPRRARSLGVVSSRAPAISASRRSAAISCGP